MADGAEAGSVLGISIDRARVETGLETLVAENRFTIAVIFPVVGAVSLLAGATSLLPRSLAFNPYLLIFGVLVMRLPLIAGVGPLLDRTASALMLGLCCYAYVIEYVGIRTGWPYGEFAYLVDLGPMISGVPVGLPLFFLPLVLNAYLLSILLLGSVGAGRLPRLGATLAVVLVIDLVLDPGAVAIGFWAYLDGGSYYGVPLSNYGGWLLSGAIGVAAFDRAFDRAAVLERLEQHAFMLDDLVSFVLLWGLVNLAFGNWIAVALAGALGLGLVRTDRFDFAVFAGSRWDPR